MECCRGVQKGVRGKPRFKGARGLSSIEDKSTVKGNLRLKDKKILYGKMKRKNRTKKSKSFELPLLYDLRDPVHYHGLSSRVKYVRLVRRNFNGKIRYFAQLVCEGKPFIKPQHKRQEGVVGLDIGPSTIATVPKRKK